MTSLNKSYSVPSVLLLVFNRPDTTRKAISALREIRPKKLFIAADGPRKNSSDKHKCKEVREILKNIDWDCKVERLYRNVNLGAGVAVPKAISWFLSKAGEGIILEDDCIPNESFFRFTAVMLDKYRQQDEVMVIKGDNFLPTQIWKDNGYFFSKYLCPPWGWATWDRAWKKYDGHLKDWPVVRQEGQLNANYKTIWERLYWETHFDALYTKQLKDIWDYQWQYSVWKNNGKIVAPGVNLIENIGMGLDGTHVNLSKGRLSPKAIEMSEPFVLQDENYSEFAENYLLKHIFRISPLMIILQKIYYMFR
jgi:hypothetical protein